MFLNETGKQRRKQTKKNKRRVLGHALLFIQLGSVKYWIFFLCVAGHDFVVGSFQISALLRIFFLAIISKNVYFHVLRASNVAELVIYLYL